MYMYYKWTIISPLLVAIGENDVPMYIT